MLDLEYLREFECERTFAYSSEMYDTVERGLHEQINAQLQIPRSYTFMNLYYQSKYSFNDTNVFYDDLNYKKEIIAILSLPPNH